MANPVHFELLCQGPAAWNAWREANPEVVPDLSRAAPSLNQRQFGPSNGGPIDLSGANLENAMLRFATLTAANLEGAHLAGADLMHARLDRANLTGANLTDTLLDSSDLLNSRLDGAVVVGASFRNARHLFQHQVQCAHGDASTLLPQGLVPPREWFPVDVNPEDFVEFPRYPAQPVKEDDPYDLLGVPPSAPPEEIRNAYRKLVKQFHPDLNPGNAEAELRFRKINEAYRSLKEMEEEAGQYQPRSARSRRLEAVGLAGVFVLVGGGVYMWLEQSAPTIGQRQVAIHQEAPARTLPRNNIVQPEKPAVVNAEAPHSPKAAEAPAEKPPVTPELPPKVEVTQNVAAPADTAPAQNGGTMPTSAEIKSPAFPAEKTQPPVEPQSQPQATDQGSVDTQKAPAGHMAVLETRPFGDEQTTPKPESFVSADKAKPEPVSEPEAAAEPQASAKAQLPPVDNVPERKDTAAPLTTEPAVETQPVKLALWEEEWQPLRDSSDLTALHGYIKRHSKEPAAEEARARFRAVVAELTDPAVLTDFVKANAGQNTPELTEVKAQLTRLSALKVEQTAWEAAVKKNTRVAYEGYLRTYSTGPHAAEASEKIAALREIYRKRDEAAWNKARKDNTLEAYAAYVAAHPRGYFLKEAQKKVAELAKPKPAPAKPGTTATTPAATNTTTPAPVTPAPANDTGISSILPD